MRTLRKAALLGIGLLLSPGPAAWIAPSFVVGTAAGIATVAYSDSAEARASSSSSRSSGGYSRPSGSSSSRTPSFSAPSSSSSSSSGSGGYRRPSLAPPSNYSAPAPSRQSASDRELSRSQSGQTLDQFRAQQAPPAAAAKPPPASSPVPQTRRSGQSDGWSNPGWNSGGSWGTGSSRGAASPPPTYQPGTAWGGNWAPGRNWAPPGYAYNTPRRFGIWDGLFLWFLLDNLTRPGYADFFHNHRSDPGYEQWRAEADQRAKSDAELRTKLNDLDTKLTEKRGQPVDANYLPPDVPRDVAVAEGGGPGEAPAPASKSRVGFGLILAVVLLAVGALVVLWLARRRREPRSTGVSPSTSPASQAGNILKQAVSDVAYKPSLFRVGMILTADPTPFILAGTATKVNVPEIAEAAGGLISVEAVGKLTLAGTELHRLYLPGGRTFFQLHLDSAGHPDECRCFSLIDEVNPADAGEWGFWLDPAEGMIGWPEFQTKDGKLYPRHWAPGQTRIEPRRFTETLSDVNGQRTRQVQAMLYAAPTGAASPAPDTEYLLVAVLEEGGRAWVEIHAGIAVNPASLSLA